MKSRCIYKCSNILCLVLDITLNVSIHRILISNTSLNISIYHLYFDTSHKMMYPTDTSRRVIYSRIEENRKFLLFFQMVENF